MPSFLDKAVSRVGKGVTSVSVKSKELLEATKIKSQVQELSENRRATVEELGSIAFAQFAKGSFDEHRLKVKCSEISNLDGPDCSKASGTCRCTFESAGRLRSSKARWSLCVRRRIIRGGQVLWQVWRRGSVAGNAAEW